MRTNAQPQLSLFGDDEVEAPRTRRFIGRCQTCRKVQADDVDDANEWRYGRGCCGRTVQLLAVRGTHSDSRRCDARCLNATRPDCECSCSGVNHGAAHTASAFI